ncbi:hypothetical protein AArcS_1571 [Natranaeroarchaeum sulfidigenes]|uniref:Uncharacterized protein n=1 Tax=Natranaeroarchaeum sulfidigenes TaxID=2784880 RepID=A0A897MQT2_9EURY|nr:hypothetical protein AArcS_1571 [Natranaeroarchaeum sulfidigenes]
MTIDFILYQTTDGQELQKVIKDGNQSDCFIDTITTILVEKAYQIREIDYLHG